MQGSQKDQYVKKLRNIVENGTKSQDTLIELTPNSGRAEITEPVLNLKPTSDHDDRYEKFEAFIKEQRDFNKKIESHISSNSIEISECTIELKDLEQKCKNQAKEVKLYCENHIQAVKEEIGEEVQKWAKQIANLSSKLSSDLKTLKTKASSTEDSIKHILQQLNEIKNQVCISEQSLISQLQEKSHQDPSSQLSTVTADSNEYTYTVAMSNRYETLVEENRSIVESIPPNTQPNLCIIYYHFKCHCYKNATTNLPAQRSTCFYILLKSESPKWAIIKGTGAVVRRFDHKRNTAGTSSPQTVVNKQTIAGGTR